MHAKWSDDLIHSDCPLSNSISNSIWQDLYSCSSRVKVLSSAIKQRNRIYLKVCLIIIIENLFYLDFILAPFQECIHQMSPSGDSAHDFRHRKDGLALIKSTEGKTGHSTIRRRAGWLEEK